MPRTTDPAAGAASSRVAVWDLPTRLFHWTLVGLIGFSWWSAEEEHVEWHMWSGYAVLTLLLFRVMWGFVGSSTARFRNFIRGPRTLLGYLRNTKGWTAVGHTPLGALSVVALLGLLAIQVATGLINSDDDGLYEGGLAPLVSYDLSDLAHDLHEDLFDYLLILIGLHIAAILFYRLFMGKRLVGPMITGMARDDGTTEPMQNGKWWAALLCLIIALAITRWIIAGVPPFSS